MAIFGSVFILAGLVIENIFSYYLIHFYTINVQSTVSILLMTLLISLGVIFFRYMIYNQVIYNQDAIFISIIGLLFFLISIESMLGINAPPYFFIFVHIKDYHFGLLISFILFVTSIVIYFKKPMKEKDEKHDQQNNLLTYNIKNNESFLQKIIHLIRVDYWIGSLILLLYSLFIFGGYLQLISFILSILAFCAINSFVFIQNQYVDIDTDKLNIEKSNLPLVTGEISKKFSMSIMGFFLIISFLLGFFISLYFMIGLIIYILVWTFYSCPPTRFKGKPVVDLLMHAVGFGLIPIILGNILANKYVFIPSLAFGAMFIYGGSHCIHQAGDYEADKNAGLRTTAVFLGKSKALKLAASLIFSGFILFYYFLSFHTFLLWFWVKVKTVFLLSCLGLFFSPMVKNFRKSLKKKDSKFIHGMDRSARNTSYLIFFIVLLHYILNGVF